MIANIFTIFFTIVFLLIPILVWLFLYESFSKEFIKRRHIIFWMFLWSLITLPIVLSSQNSFTFVFEKIFWYLYVQNTLLLSIWFLGSMLCMYGIFFLILSLIKKSFSGMWFLMYSMLIVSIVSIALVFWYMLVTWLWVGSDIFLPESRLIFGVIFSSFLSIFWYYLIVSLLEESGKFMWHLSQAHKKHYIVSLSHFLTFSVSIAVWFSFFENILYTYMQYANEGIGFHLVVLVFFRGLISLSLHVLCTLLFSLGMWHIWNLWSVWGKQYMRYLLYSLPIFISILFHTLFNVSLTFGYVGVVFLVFFGLYFVVAYMIPQSLQKNAL